MDITIDSRQAIREALRKSYLHRTAEGCVCALCGESGRPLAFHLLEKSVKESELLPDGFVPMAISMGYIKGSFPLCDKCAPPCPSCQLPIYTYKVRKYGNEKQASLGLGYCREHISLKNLISVFHLLFFK